MAPAASNPVPPFEPDWLTAVRSQVESLRYGFVQLVVHDGRVTQIERTERLRLEPPSRSPSARLGGDER